MGDVSKAKQRIAKRCQHVKSNGQPCGAYAITGSDFCFWHAPETQEKRAESVRRGGRNRRQVRYIPGEPGSWAIQTPGDVLELLEAAVNEIMPLEPSLAKSRTLGYLASMCFRGVELVTIEARLTALEEQLASERQSTRGNGRYGY